MHDLRIETFVVNLAWLLLGAALIGMVAQRLSISYAVALVIAGLLLEESHIVEVPRLEPSLLLFAFLPPLLFDASFRLDARELRPVVRPVLLLAVPGVVMTAVLVGGGLSLILGLPIGVALLFGAIVAATDPVAVVAVVKKLKMPEGLAVTAEAESLINDGMAITLYTALSGFAVTGEMRLWDNVGVFGREVLGGVVIGAALGIAASRVTRLLDDHLLEMMLSTVLAYGSYLVAASLHASGPLACVAAGFIHGTYGRSIGMSRQTSERLDDLWEYLGFLANAIVFLLVGFTASVGRLREEAWPVTAAILAVLVARIVVVRLLRPTSGVDGMTHRGERIVLVWAGLRGALTIALALALPVNTPSRELVIAMAFGVVLFTLVVQGLTFPFVLRRLGPRLPEGTAGGSVALPPADS